MKIAILGYNTEGRSSYDYFASQGHELTICDQNTEVEVPNGANSVLGANYLDDLDRFDLLVRTAGLKPSLILDANPDVADKITTQLNEFLKICPTKNVIGITGTKGKGTTSTLTTMMLQAAGKQVELGGNIGVPVLSLLDKLTPESWVVLELSSFQLIDIKSSPHIAVCVMVVPEHLNWHLDLEEYIEAKTNLFRYQASDDLAIYFGENANSKRIASAGKGQKLAYYAPDGATIDNGRISISGQVICRTDELKLLGQHNWQNACAAVTICWQIEKNPDALRSVLTSFTGLPHRLEFVRELHGLSFFNDSFASSLHATEAAVEAIKGKKVMILGGFDRMLNIDYFGVFAKSHESEFRKLLLIGDCAKRVAAALEEAGFTNYSVSESQSMSEIIGEAVTLAETGDSVVLSPGFASFDMFKNFEDRGLQFKEAVNNL
ncbi:MAG: UDP-N-acetylmuramoyl-L-alanine--D-glutamate ligase [Patescibacteria group bacterium]